MIMTPIYECYVIRFASKNIKLLFFFKELELRAQDKITILDFKVNIIGGEGGLVSLTNEHEIIHLDDEEDIYMSSEDHKGSGYNLNLDLLTITN